MFSRPGLKTQMSLEWIQEKFTNHSGAFEIQLEGGEPMIHPDFDKILQFFNGHPNCSQIIITTNATRLATTPEGIAKWLKQTQKPFLIKPSINSHLLAHDAQLLDKCQLLLRAASQTSNITVRFNVRRLKDQTTNDEAWILDKLNEYGLTADSNIWYFQRYGFGANSPEYDPPFIVANPLDFHLLAPDGQDFGQDLIARSQHMLKLFEQDTASHSK